VKLKKIFNLHLTMNQLVERAQSRIMDSVEAASKNKILDGVLNAMDKSGAFGSVIEKGMVAQLLQNFKKVVMDKVTDSSYGATRGQSVNVMSDFGPYVPEVLPVVAAWYPEFPLKDLISVQTMEQDLAYLLFSKLVTGTNKAPTLVGQVVETALGQRQIDGYYPTGVVIGEQIPGNQMTVVNSTLIGATVYHALKTTGDYLRKFKITVNVSGEKTVYRAFAVAGGEIRLALATAPDQEVEGAKWDIESGAFYLPTSESNTENVSVVLNYVWNLDYAVDENIPKVKEQVERFEMRAEPRVLAMQWTIFAEALKKSQFKTDIRTENTTRVLNVLYQYQVRYVLDEMYEDAAGVPATITVPRQGIYSLDVAYNNVMNQLNSQATNIEYATGRMEGNRLVVGRDFKNWLESLPSTMYQPKSVNSGDAGWSSPREIGTVGKFKVYFDPRRQPDEGFMTYRGIEWFDSSYYMGIFLPMVPTDALAINVTVRQAFASMEAYHMHKPEAIIPLTFKFQELGE